MRFRIVGAVAGLMACIAVGVFAQSVPDVLGPWKMSIDAAGQKFDVTITFKESNGALGGTISSPRGDAEATNVKLEGDQLSWDAQMGPAALSLKVTVTGDTFAGSSETPFGPVVLSGKKLSAEEIAAMGAQFDGLVGDWETNSEWNGKSFESKLRLAVADGRLMGAVLGGGGQTRPGDEATFFVMHDGDTLKWEVQLPYITQNGGEAEVKFAGGTFEGVIKSELGDIPIKGKLVDTTKLISSPYDDPAPVLGDWETTAMVNGVENHVTLAISVKDDRLEAVIESEIGDIFANTVEYNKIGEAMGVIRLTANVPEVSQEELLFELIIDGDTFEGEEINTGTITLKGTKAAAVAAQPEGLTGKHVMALLDRDSDGKITMEESPEQLKQNFMMVDANADSGVDLAEAEMIAMFMNGQYGGPGKGANEIVAEMIVGMMDANMDGKVTEDEVTEEQMKSNFATVDANKDGAIDKTEALVIGDFLIGQAEAEAPGNQLTGAMVMQMLDTDADGKITLEEAPEQLKANYAMVDANADGGIDATEAEVIAMFLNAQQQQSAPASGPAATESAPTTTEESAPAGDAKQ